jgi:transposase InsO family protein
VREWVKQAERDAGTRGDGALTSAEREELARLRRGCRRLREDVEILKRATAFFADTAAGLGIRLKHPRPYRPQTNGKVERYNRTVLNEWAYARLYRSNPDRRRALGRFLSFYNHRRPHTALGGLTPMAVLVNNVDGNHN